jgi:hypothetical protein
VAEDQDGHGIAVPLQENGDARYSLLPSCEETGWKPVLRGRTADYAAPTVLDVLTELLSGETLVGSFAVFANDTAGMNGF